MNVTSFHPSHSEIEIRQYGNHVKFVLCESMDETLCSTSGAVTDSRSYAIRTLHIYIYMKLSVSFGKETENIWSSHVAASSIESIFG